MAIPVKSLEEMIRDVIASLQAGKRGSRPIYTLLLGSGFSYPIVPTPTQMLKSDVAWWRFCKDRRVDGPFRSRADAVAEQPAVADEIAEFERTLWKTIHASCSADASRQFPLGADGLPDLTHPENVGRAYDAVMSQGLINDGLRRQYLREAIARSGRKVNGAHIFLAGILEVQETWNWGASLCRTIFTTNFDPLLQRSLQLVNKLYYMTDRPEVLDTPDDDQSDAIHLIYTHGSVHRYGLLNTGDQIEKARRQNAARLVGYLQRHGVIVMGYSGWSDTTMQALLSCSSFDSGLYWCDIHPADQAEARLRPEVLELLRESGKDAYYVHIPSADEAMRQLHRALKLGDVPKFILEPVPTLIEQLKSIEVPTELAGSSGAAGPALSGNDMATLLAGTLHGLEVARLAFDDPSLVKPSSPQTVSEVARAFVARTMRNAFVAYSEGRGEEAIALWSTVIATGGVPAEDRATALRNRGWTYGQAGRIAEAIADYTAVIGMADASAELKAKALVNRGVAHGQAGRIAEEIEDYTAVVGMADAPAEQKAGALYNRGVEHGKAGRIAEAIEDYTAVVGMADAPGEQKASAFANRGWVRFITGDVQALREDSRKALELAPDDNTARINLALGLLLTGEIDPAIAEYEQLVAQTDDAEAIRSAIDDLQAETTKRPDLPGAERALALLTTAEAKVRGGTAPA